MTIDREIIVCKWLTATVIVVWLVLGFVAKGQIQDQLDLQQARWDKAVVSPRWSAEIDAALRQYEATKGRYQAVENMRPGGVPAIVVFTLHGRESTWSFRCHLHEGSPLSQKTRFVPKGRPPGNPPFTWEQSAEDALYVLKNMQSVKWDSVPRMLQAIELFNGLGYQKYHKDVPSPYLWSGTNLYTRGKYVADGRFCKFTVDRQIGCAAILKAYYEKRNR